MTYIMAANTVLSPLGDLSIQSNLNTLMYNGVGDFDGAKRLFQTDLGEQPAPNAPASRTLRSSRFSSAAKLSATRPTFMAP